MAIRRLEPLVVDQIAAGEVIERPASVVKELVENALDAGATSIQVEIAEGGTRLIRIRDDGLGMGAADLELAFVSHATSKLSGVEDLDRIASFGFRGEALASIGAVARARILSCPRDGDAGAEVRCAGGRIEPVRPAACPPGTTVEVEDLFYNTPARKKFLRTPAAERGRIADLVSRLALVNLDVAWVLRAEGREVLAYPAGSDLVERTTQALGRDFGGAAVAVEGARGEATVTGLVADPGRITWRDARRQLLFVNGRLIKDRTLAVAVQKGLEEALMVGRRPGFVLFLHLPPEQVDVNVHPTKTEVRFRAPNLLFALVRDAVRPVAGGLDRSIQAGGDPPSFPPSAPRTPAGERIGDPPAAAGPGRTRALFPADLEESAWAPPAPPAAGGDAPAPVSPSPETSAAAGPPVLQVGDTFLVVPWGDGMAVVDQHALHERILYEELRAALAGEAGVAVQRLLAPALVEVDREDKETLLAAGETLARLGFSVADFGSHTVAVEGIPALLGHADPAELLEELLASLRAGEGARSTSLTDRLATAACRAAVKGGERMTPAVAAGLLRRAGKTPGAGHCPHGRPTFLIWTRADLERLFKRTV